MQVPGLAAQGSCPVVLEGRGAVDQRGHRSERGRRLRDQLAGGGLVRQVCSERDGLAAHGLDRAHDLLGGGRVGAIMNGDVEAGLGQPERNGPPYPTAGAGDEG